MIPELDPERCLRFRCRGFACTRCVDACRTGALHCDGILRVEPGRCTGCGACVAACPADGLQSADPPFESVLAGLQGIDRPVLGCRGDVEVQGHMRVTCFAVLASEQLIALAAFVSQGVQLNATRCAGCPRGEAVAALGDRLRDLGANAATVELIRDEEELAYREPICDRRAFFRSLGRGTAARTARFVCPERPEASEGRAKKALPRRRELFNSVLEHLPEGRRERVRGVFRHRVTFSQECTGCPRCAAMCPTGALVRERGEAGRTLRFDATRCTGCGVCAAFCPLDALALDPPEGRHAREFPGKARRVG